MLSILKLGFSPFLISSTDSVIIILLNAMLKQFGGADADFYIEVATIVSAFESLLTGPLLGISSGTQPILGYNYGAKRIDLLKKAEKQLLLFALAFCCCGFGLSFLLSRPFAEIFAGSSGNEAVIDGAVKYIRWYMYAIIPLAFQYVCVDGLTGMGQAKYSLWLSLNRKVFILVPLTILLPLLTGNASFCFMAQPIADACSGIVSLIAYYIVTPKIFKKRVAETAS